VAESHPFQVDLKGVVDLLGRHIYSSPRVYLRELLQNGVDAITARRQHCQEAGQPVQDSWGIRIYPAAGADAMLTVVDDGIGLTADEVTDLLATVGKSSKRDILGMPRTDYLGQFGIGLLSCFMVSDEIRIVSQSATGGKPVEWVGRDDGVFEVRELNQAVPVGTSVSLKARFDMAELLGPDTVRQLAHRFGQYLPVPISVVAGPDKAATAINEHPVFLDAEPDHSSLMAFAEDAFGFEPLDYIDLNAPGTGTRGKAFVLPTAPPPTARPSAAVYLSGMLLNERVFDLLPDWAFFVRAVVDSTGLSPTASREGIVEDFKLEYTSQQLGACVRGWLTDMALHQPVRFQQFLDVHERAVKQLVLHDETLRTMFIGWLSVETSAGRLTIEKLVAANPNVRYARTMDEYRQVVSIARGDSPLVNGGYVFDSELIEMLPEVYPTVTVTRVDVLAELDRLDPPSLDDRSVTAALEDRATAVLRGRDCQALVRLMQPDDVPALFVADPDMARHIDRVRGQEVASTSLWSEILATTDALALARSSHAEQGFTTRLCLNWTNPLTRSLAKLSDDAVFTRCLQLLYVQSQLAGSYPLSSEDRALMTSALSDLIDLTTKHERK